MAKVRKKNNQIARAARLAQHLLKKAAICQLSTNKCEVIDLKTAAPMKGSVDDMRFVAGCMENYQYNWTVALLVFCRDPSGTEYMRELIVDSERKCYSGELEEILRDTHNKLIKELNHNHLLCAGWIAAPIETDFDLEALDKIFTNLGAFNKFITKLENKNAS